MTLLVTAFAAIISTIVWYKSEQRSVMHLGTLTLIYWGATLMWLVDSIMEYAEAGAEFFLPAGTDMLNDLFLGLCAVALGLIIWLVIVLVKDPKGVLKKAILKR